MDDDDEDDELLKVHDHHQESSINNDIDITPDEKADVQLTKSRKRIMLIATYILYMTSFAAVSTIAPFYTTEALKKGSTKSISGAVFAASPIVIFFISPIIGKYLTKLGPIFVLLSGAFLEAGCELLFGFIGEMPSTETFVTYSFLIRIVMSIGSAFSQTATLAIVSVFYQENISFIMGLFEFGCGIGSMIGPALGGFLFDIGGFRLPFLVLGSLMFVLLFAIYLAVPKQKDLALLNSNEEGSVSVKSVLKIPGVLLANLTIIYCGIGIAFFEAIFSVHLTDITNGSISKTTIGLFFLSSNAVYAVSSILFGYCGEKCIKSENTVLLGHIFSSLFYFLIGPAPFLLEFIHPSLLFVGISFNLLGIGWAPLIVLPFKCMQNAMQNSGHDIDLQNLGLLSGLITSSYNIGAAIGPLYGGLMLEYLSFQWATFVLSIGFLILGVLQAIYILFSKQSQTDSCWKKNERSHDSAKDNDDNTLIV